MGKLTKSKSTQKTEPWSEAQPMLRKGIRGATDLYNDGGFNVNPYQGQRVAGINPLERQGLGMIRRGADRGFGAMDSGLEYAQSVGNFGAQDVTQIGNDAMSSAINRANDQFMSAGMDGSSLHQAEAIGAATRALAPIQYGAQEAAMARKLAAAGLMPGLARGYTAAGVDKARAGARLTDQKQRRIDARMERHQEVQEAPISEQERFARLAAMFGQMGGAQTGTKTPSLLSSIGKIGKTAVSAYGGFGG